MCFGVGINWKDFSINFQVMPTLLLDTWTVCGKFLKLIGRRLKRISDIKLLPIEVASCIVYLSANLFVQNS